MSKEWTNPRGNKCELKLIDSRTTDYYVQIFNNTNWQRFETDEDSLGFGIWVNSHQKKILIFAEMGEVLIACNNADLFKTGIADMIEQYRSN